uniref:Uncharacterized protein n=1 Tax=Solibacter usitatus (strain Ellin6076) TaxID=234267 RepID=Q021E2_SOLUE
MKDVRKWVSKGTSGVKNLVSSTVPLLRGVPFSQVKVGEREWREPIRIRRGHLGDCRASGKLGAGAERAYLGLAARDFRGAVAGIRPSFTAVTS